MRFAEKGPAAKWLASLFGTRGVAAYQQAESADGVVRDHPTLIQGLQARFGVEKS